VTGNDRDAARVGGRAKIRVRGPFGVRLDETGNLAVPELLPGAQVTLTERIAGVPPAGRLGAAVTLNSVAAEGAVADREPHRPVWAPPWVPLVGLLVLAALAAAAVLVRWRRRATARNHRADTGSAETGAAFGQPVRAG
jgi:hypothetical protein